MGHRTHAARLTAHTTNTAVMQALADAWNTLTDEQKADFTNNAGGYEAVTAAISLGGASARLAAEAGTKKPAKITTPHANT